MGLSVALVLPRISGTHQSARIKTTVRKTANLIRLAQVRAVLERRECRVLVDREEGRVTLQKAKAEEEETDSPAKSIVLPEELIILRVDTDGSNRKKKKKSTHKGRRANEIAFFPMGNSSGGKIYLGKERDQRQYVIEINPFNGRVTVLYETKPQT
jgi:Tfp pilus assembly protein FimT